MDLGSSAGFYLRWYCVVVSVTVVEISPDDIKFSIFHFLYSVHWSYHVTAFGTMQFPIPQFIVSVFPAGYKREPVFSVIKTVPECRVVIQE